jgi:hypothetical protein
MKTPARAMPNAKRAAFHRGGSIRIGGSLDIARRRCYVR